MKFLAFTDIHADPAQVTALMKRAAKDDIDFLLCCGDFTEFGSGFRYVLKRMNKIGKKIYTIPGNHEDGVEFESAVKEYENWINFDHKAVRINGYVFLGYGSGGFALTDAEFRKIARKWYGQYKNEKIILVTHGPAYGTVLDKLEMGHVGNKDYRKFIERIKPKLAFSGHLHESFGMVDTLGGTKLVNPGDEGMVIELK